MPFSPRPRGQVLADLPVEGGLERVLDREGAALDEEHVVGVALRHREVREGLDEASEVLRVDVARRGLRQGRFHERFPELGVLHLRMVVADRNGREAGEEVQDRPVAARVVEVGAAAPLHVHDDVVPVDEDVAGEDVEDVLRRELLARQGRHGELLRRRKKGEKAAGRGNGSRRPRIPSTDAGPRASRRRPKGGDTRSEPAVSRKGPGSARLRGSLPCSGPCRAPWRGKAPCPRRAAARSSAARRRPPASRAIGSRRGRERP